MLPVAIGDGLGLLGGAFLCSKQERGGMKPSFRVVAASPVDF